MMTMQVFCVPHAGGSATAFLRWRRFVGCDVEITPIELAGRGGRIDEPPFRRADDAGNDVAAQILKHRQPGVPYAVWGHSMGSLISYEAYFALQELTVDLPEHLIFSGRTPPHLPLRKSNLHTIPNDDSFIAAVDSYGGGTREALADPGIRELYLPILRADFELSEKYVWKPRQGLIESRVSVINGARDLSINHPQISEWQELVAPQVDFRITPGDHFFLFANDEGVRQMLCDLQPSNVQPRHLSKPKCSDERTLDDH